MRRPEQEFAAPERPPEDRAQRVRLDEGVAPDDKVAAADDPAEEAGEERERDGNDDKVAASDTHAALQSGFPVS